MNREALVGIEFLLILVLGVTLVVRSSHDSGPAPRATITTAAATPTSHPSPTRTVATATHRPKVPPKVANVTPRPQVTADAETMAALRGEKPLPKSWQDTGGQEILDQACLAVQATVQAKYGLDAGCDWNFENGPGAPALLHMHVPGDEYDEHHVSREALELAGESGLAHVRGAGSIFGPFIPEVVIDRDQ